MGLKREKKKRKKEKENKEKDERIVLQRSEIVQAIQQLNTARMKCFSDNNYI